MADDQDKLAQEWADALLDGDDAGDAGDAAAGLDADDPLGGLENVTDPSEAGSADVGGDDEALADEWAAALAETEQDEVKHEKEQAFLSTQTHDYDFKDMGPDAKAGSASGKRDLDFILDIPLEVSAELGRTKLLINELLQLGQGSVVELNKLAGEPLEIYVNGKLVARGEAVVINEKFGIRLTDIISPIERVNSLDSTVAANATGAMALPVVDTGTTISRHWAISACCSASFSGLLPAASAWRAGDGYSGRTGRTATHGAAHARAASERCGCASSGKGSAARCDGRTCHTAGQGRCGRKYCRTGRKEEFCIVSQEEYWR